MVIRVGVRQGHLSISTLSTSELQHKKRNCVYGDSVVENRDQMIINVSIRVSIVFFELNRFQIKGSVISNCCNLYTVTQRRSTQQQVAVLLDIIQMHYY